MAIISLPHRSPFFTSAVGWVAKCLTIVFTIINVRMINSLVGLDGFGVNAYLGNFLPWLVIIHLGLPWTLQNRISELKAQEKQFGGVIAFINKTVGVLFLLSLILSGLFAQIFSGVNILSNLSFISLWICIMAMFCGMLTEFYSRALFALHRGYIANSMPAVVSGLAFLLLLFFKIVGVKSLNIVLIGFFSPHVVSLLLSKHFTNSIAVSEKPIVVNRDLRKKAVGFLVFALLSNCVLNVDYFVIGYVLGKSELALYAIIQKYFLTIIAFYTTFLAALWPILSEAIFSREFHIVDSLIVKTILKGFVFSLISGLIFLAFKKEIVNLLTGSILEIDDKIIYAAILYVILRVFTDLFSIVFLCSNRASVINMFIPFQALVSLIGSYFLTQKFGLIGVYYGLSLSFVLTVGWGLPYNYFKLRENECSNRS